MMSGNIHCIGVNDRRIDLFESQYAVPNGVSYNSYIIADVKDDWADEARRYYIGIVGKYGKLVLATTVRLLSAPDADSNKQLDALAEELCREYLARQDETANKNDLSALFPLDTMAH